MLTLTLTLSPFTLSPFTLKLQSQVALYYWEQVLNCLVAETHGAVTVADVAPARLWATQRRSSFYWYIGAHPSGALLYDPYKDLLFAVKGLMSSIPFLLEEHSGAAKPGTPPLLRRRVVIHGLTGRPELNGEKALALTFDESTGR